MSIQVQEAYRTPNKTWPKQNFPTTYYH
jgi:hypothetical protein